MTCEVEAVAVVEEAVGRDLAIADATDGGQGRAPRSDVVLDRGHLCVAVDVARAVLPLNVGRDPAAGDRDLLYENPKLIEQDHGQDKVLIGLS